jgi:hypothetical protein
MIGLSILICLGVLTWDDALEQKGAWVGLALFTHVILQSKHIQLMTASIKV